MEMSKDEFFMLLKPHMIEAAKGGCIGELLMVSSELAECVANKDHPKQMEVKIRLREKVMYYVAKSVDSCIERQHQTMPDFKLDAGEMLEHFIGTLITIGLRDILSRPSEYRKEVFEHLEKLFNEFSPKTS